MEIKLYLQRVYEELHAHPELSLEEVWTAGFVADELRGWAFLFLLRWAATAWWGSWIWEVPD